MKIGLVWMKGAGPKSPKAQRIELRDYGVHELSLDDDRPLEERRIEPGDDLTALYIAALANDPASLVRGFVKMMLAGATLFVRETGKTYREWPQVAELATDFQAVRRKQQTEKAVEARAGSKKKRPGFWPDDAAVAQARTEWKNPAMSIQAMADSYGTDRRTLRKWAKVFKFGPKPDYQP